jgi:hypothetical protein
MLDFLCFSVGLFFLILDIILIILITPLIGD